MLPDEIWSRIFEYDPTYKNLFHKCLHEIPDIKIAKAHKQYYEKLLQQSNLSFNIDTISSSCPYLSITVGDFTFFGNFTTVQFINTDHNKRSIYDNDSVINARNDGIDTRLRPWEWWLHLNYNNTTTILSCSYQQVHGVLLEIISMENQNSMTKQITESTAKQLYTLVKDCWLSSDNGLHCRTQQKDYAIHNSCLTIPNAMIRTYDFSLFTLN